MNAARRASTQEGAALLFSEQRSRCPVAVGTTLIYYASPPILVLNIFSSTAGSLQILLVCLCGMYNASKLNFGEIPALNAAEERASKLFAVSRRTPNSSGFPTSLSSEYVRIY